MSIKSLVVDTAGQIGVHPRIVKMVSTDTIDKITTVGYVQNHPLASVILPTDVILCSFDSGTPNVPEWGLFTPLITNGSITLDPSAIEELATIVNYIATFSDTVGTLQNGSNPAISPGIIQSGTNGGGVTGGLHLYPPTASSGSLLISSANLSTNSQVSITTAGTFGQSTSFVIGDPASASGTILTANGQGVDGNGANFIYNKKTLNAVNLMLGQHVTIQPSSGSKSYIITDIWVAPNTNFSNDGNRLLSITDGTHVYTAITSPLLLSLVNKKWGDSSVPLPVSVATNQPTTPGAPLFAVYSGGSADYSTGLINLTINLTRVA